MPLQVVNLATTACTFGMGQGVLMVTPEKRAGCLEGVAPKANVMDYVPFKNILPIGMCSSPGNPAFVAATSAALGTPTPVPCTPMVSTPWVPGAARTMVGPALALHQACTAMCSFGGVISITNAGQATVNVN